MLETTSEAEPQNWIIAPEMRFSRSVEDLAQIEVLNSVVFLETKDKAREALDEAFKDAARIFDQYLLKIIDPAISKDQFKKNLPREPESIGDLYGRTGFLASRDEKAKYKSAVNACFGARRALIALKHIHASTYVAAIGRIETARRNASIGIPKLSKTSRKALVHLGSLETEQFAKAVIENASHIVAIEAFHEAVRGRFGLAHKIFGQTQTALTEEQRVHFDVLKVHEQDIRQAQSLVRSIALLGGDDEPLELDLEREWGHGR